MCTTHDVKLDKSELKDPSLTVTKNDDNSESVTIDLSKIKGSKLGNTGHYVIMYTCNVCEHRQARTFTKGAYHKGVVLVR
jgi:hypothetical protein